MCETNRAEFDRETGIRTIARMDTISKDTIPKDTIPKDTIPNGHPEWTRFLIGTIQNLKTFYSTQVYFINNAIIARG